MSNMDENLDEFRKGFNNKKIKLVRGRNRLDWATPSSNFWLDCGRERGSGIRVSYS